MRRLERWEPWLRRIWLACAAVLVVGALLDAAWLRLSLQQADQLVRQAAAR